ncbi:MAG TPA: PSD1 and planctomycete cytochrome C domain-containing protein [Planctomycetaceae bacterium]|jgi:mono/diheme cytochrome c family protein|nr:PSD1 and planctomycete cytochrome C domain-containing protein [Planctomycetaceae bacterium]
MLSYTCRRRVFVFVLALFAAARPENRLAAASKSAAAVPADHARQMAEGLAIFTQHVRPVLIKRCLKCHGGEAEAQSGFNLATREGLLAGGLNGKAVVLGKSQASRLYRLIAHAEEPNMPQDAPKLSAAEIAHVADWIDRGAPYDESLLPPVKREPVWTERTVDAKFRRFWAFQPLKVGAAPRLGDARARTPIDAFIERALAQKKIGLSPEIDRRQLIRRVSFELTGLPPTPAEVVAFVNDPSPLAYDALLDRLLASPHYGNRWARHWLDLARFAESHGFEHDYDRETAYHFRDFVIRAFNSDLPFDTFLRWQLAGDELAPHDNLAMMATGFLAAGVHSTQITKNEVEKQRYDELDDMLATTGTAMLGLSVGCARCHDHKFDPIPQADYYRLLSAFTTTVRSEVALPLGPKGTKPVKVLVASEGLPAVRLHSQGDDFFKQTFFLRRGDVNQKQGAAPLGFLQVLMRTPDAAKHWAVQPPAGSRTSFRRTALADWITDPQYGAGQLAARVIVNRLWQHHLGHGIVATPNDFGARGEAPSHPELLDWLAGELIRHEWRLKPIQRLILTSAVYLQDSKFDPAKEAVDPGNRLFWRHEKRRLEGEVVRDALLACGNLLDERMYGPGTLDERHHRRAIYFTVKRSKLVPMMQVFDAPEALSSIGDRPSTTIAPQALLLLNNPNVRQCARAFARRLLPAWDQSPEAALREAYLLALGREPDPEELKDSAAFIAGQMASHESALKANAPELALLDFCQVLLCLNEFVYVD